MDQRAGMGVLVAAQRFAGDPVDVGEPVDPAAHQDRVHGRGGHTEPPGDLDRAQPVPPAWTVPDLVDTGRRLPLIAAEGIAWRHAAISPRSIRTRPSVLSSIPAEQSPR
ncbi:hypothetical protein Ae505Ps2_6066 [Pseudonocardia sp. Ae505_Ps2]|nr:hypothetical protein Ae505Ps2_6066 [Pseudonocardia sp. Ae505_Ps2]